MSDNENFVEVDLACGGTVAPVRDVPELVGKRRFCFHCDSSQKIIAVRRLVADSNVIKIENEDYVLFTGTAIGLLPSKVRTLETVIKNMETGTVSLYDLQDLKAMVSDLKALLDKAPEFLRSLVIY